MNLKKTLSLYFIKPKLIRRVVRIVIAIFLLYILLLAGLSIYIASSKEKLLGFLNAKIKETILGELKITNADITVWQTFPKLGITLQNVSISDSFYHTPFLKAGSITAKAGIIDLMGKKVTISSVKISDAVIHTFTDAKGYTNSYVLRSQSSQKQKRQSKKPFVLENIDLTNVTVLIEDVLRHKRYRAKIDDADIDMSLGGSKYYITFRENLFLRGLGFNLPQGYWLENQRVQAKWKLEFDTGGSVLTINKTTAKIQGHPFDIDGTFDFGKSQFHINAVTKNINYGAALAILKPHVRSVLQKLDFNQPLDVAASLTGSLSKKGDPAVKVNFSTIKNGFSTPVINLNDCSFSGSFSNQYDKRNLPDDSNSRVQLNAFAGYWGTINLKAKGIALTNFDKPVIQFEFFSQCSFLQLDEALSSSNLHFADGNAKLYLAYNGPLIADPSLLSLLNAKILIQNGKVIYVPRNLTFSECNGTVDLTGNNLTINNLQCNLNTNHFVVNINGNNLNRISGNEAGRASLNCSVFSPAINLSDFKTLFNTKTTASVKRSTKGLAGAANEIDNAIENGDVFISLKAQQLLLNNFKAGNTTAVLLFTNNDWEVQKAFLQFADGSFNLSAKVHQVNNVSHQVNVQMDLQHVNVKKLFYGFDNFSQTSLTSKNINGLMDSKGNITAIMNSAGKFVPSTMNGKIFFSLKNAALVNFQPFLDIQKIAFKNRDLNNVQFAELKDTFDIQNGDIYIHRMPIQSSAITMYVDGIYSFADRTDISIQVPISSLTSNPGEDFKNKAKSKRAGASIYLRAKDKNGQVKIGLDVFKKFRKNNNKDDN
ncbi:MAG TPA: AsmA-like C-terminal region-containing protein [Parafilimonas sp.]|nr:AsmA-like C-terminal region-containing protein [Parafilimonas sp.]